MPLTMSACKAIIAFGFEPLKQTYLPNMVSGKWTGTMCMTEAHCGSDLGLIKTSATALESGQYEITGTKIFISVGEHDASDNIVHLVLARIKGAVGDLLGQPNEGIKAMFTMMNEMRLGTALQGVGREHTFQKSYQYAIERTQGKTLDKIRKSDAAADQLYRRGRQRCRALQMMSGGFKGGPGADLCVCPAYVSAIPLIRHQRIHHPNAVINR